jgi:hypothetical protein
MRIIAVTHEDGEPATEDTPVVWVNGGSEPMTPASPGHWVKTVDIADEGISRLRVTAGNSETFVAVEQANQPKARLIAPDSVSGVVGEAVSFAVRSPDGPLTDLAVTGGEGEAAIDCSVDECTVNWTPGEAPFPRAVSLLLAEPDRPRDTPTSVTVRLSAFPVIPVTTEAGAIASVRIGDREAPPQTAGADGSVRFRLEVQPGDELAVVSLEDRLGNKQSSTIVIGGKTGPQMTMARQGTIIAGAMWPKVWVSVVDASGAPFVGGTPDCQGLTQRGLLRQQAGLWVGTVDARNHLDRRVECRIPGGQPKSLLVPVDRERATRLVVQVYPPELTADIPIAEVQSYLVNGVGERLPSGNIRLSADRGTIQRDTAGDGRWVRARYDGHKAANDGSDVLQASWRRPAGTGGLWDLAISAAAPGVGDEVLLDARAVDQGGRPLAGVEVAFRVGSVQRSAKTGENGWATAIVPWPASKNTTTVHASAAGESRRAFVLRGDRPVASPGSPDLVNDTAIQITPGRVHGVVLNTSHRVLTNDGMTATISVLLEDKLGSPIRGPRVEIVSSAGEIGAVTERGDGKYSATLAPPIGMKPGKIRITANTEDGRFSASTDVTVKHKELVWSLSGRAGALAGAQGGISPLQGIAYSRKLPFRFLYIGGSVETFSLRANDIDPVTRSAVDLRLNTLMVSTGLYIRRQAGLWPVWAGGKVLVSPYHMMATIDGDVASSGWGWMSPGAALSTGVGVRMLGGEAFAEADYLFIAAPSASIGWQGPVGGLVGALGFKLLY